MAKIAKFQFCLMGILLYENLKNISWNVPSEIVWPHCVMAPLHSCVCCLILWATSVVSQNVNGYGISRQWLFFYALKFCDCKVTLILAIIEGQSHICKFHTFWKVQKNRHEWVLFLQNTKVQKLKLSKNLTTSGKYKNFVNVFTLGYIFRCV